MNKMMNVIVAIGISSFLACNFYLLYSQKSVIPKSLYISQYERMAESEYSEKVAKEGLVAPDNLYTVYVSNEDVVDQWLVKEGQFVYPGDEIASLQTVRAEGQRTIWEAEQEALENQKMSVLQLIDNLTDERAYASSDSSSNVNRSDNASKSNEDTNVEVGLNVDVQVDVKQDGPYAQALAAAEQQLSDIERQLVVVETQLSQNAAHPAIISPVEGVVSEVKREGETLAVHIYSSQKVIVTYAAHQEWTKISQGDRVMLQGGNLGSAVTGTVQSVAQTPANEDKWLQSYKALDEKEVKNPLSYYEIRILTEADLSAIPYGANVNAIVIANEAEKAIAVKEDWLIGRLDEQAKVWTISDEGKAVLTDITTPFSWKTRAVVTQGLPLGAVVVHTDSLYNQTGEPRVFMPMPAEWPEKEEWKSFGWKNYVKYIFFK